MLVKRPMCIERSMSHFGSIYCCLHKQVHLTIRKHYLDRLMQERRNSIANALGLRFCCTDPSIWFLDVNNLGYWQRYVESIMDMNASLPLGDGPITDQRWPYHDDLINWKHFPHYWPFVTGIHRSPVDSPHKGQWRRALMFFVICAWANGWANKRGAGDMKRHHAHYDVTVMGDVMSHYWPNVRGHHWSSVDSSHKTLIIWNYDF